ncbi:trigger factor [bacterium]|nr:MAG: trigger factor [bacterium]
MQVTREDLNPCTVKLTVVCEPEEVKQGYDTAFRQLTKKIKLPGFRPGKAPRAMLEGVLPSQDWNEAAAEEIVRKAYTKAVEQEGLQPDRTTSPQVSLDALSQQELKAEFTAKVPLPPKVELGDYKGLPVVQPPTDVTDEEIEYQIAELQKRGQQRQKIADRGAADGDVAVLNLQEEEGEGKSFVTVVGQSFAQLDDAIRGMGVEEMKNLELSFPENFQVKEWQGQTKKVKVTLNSLSAVTTPALDDAFAQSLQLENLDALRNRLRENIGRAKQQMVRQVLFEGLLSALMERSQVAVSDNMWETLADRRLRETAEEQQRQGKGLEQYAQENGMTVEQLVESWKERAKLEVQRALLIQSVYSAEQMQIGNAELNQELVAMAQEYGVEPMEMVQTLQQNNALDELQFRALSRRVSDFLLAHADVTIGTPGASSEASEAAPAAEAKPKKSSKKAAEAKEEAPAEEAATAEAAPESEAKPKKPRAKKAATEEPAAE